MPATVCQLLHHVRQHSHSGVCIHFDPALARLFFWITLLLYNTNAQLEGEAASRRVKSAMHRRKKGTLKRGKKGHGGKVMSRKQAIAIGLSEARKKGAKVPRKKGGRKKSSRKKSRR